MFYRKVAKGSLHRWYTIIILVE